MDNQILRNTLVEIRWLKMTLVTEPRLTRVALIPGYKSLLLSRAISRRRRVYVRLRAQIARGGYRVVTRIPKQSAG